MLSGQLSACSIILIMSLTACSTSTDDPWDAYQQGNYKQAYALWKPQAEQGNASVQSFLAMLYYLGQGVEKDYQKAFYWYQQASLRGDARAQRSLGNFYHFGYGIEIDNLLAYGWYDQAYQNGNKKAANYLLALVGKLSPNQTMKAKKVVKDMIQEHKKTNRM